MADQLGVALKLDYEHDPLLGAVGCEKAQRLPKSVVGVHGHFRPHRYLDEKDRVFFTWLRDPVDNLCSIYSLWRSYPSVGNPVHDAFLAEKPDIANFARHPQIKVLMSEVYFGHFDMGRFDFVGFHDTRDEDISRLGSLLGMSLSAEVHVNRTEPGIDDLSVSFQGPGGSRSELEAALSQELAFYEAQRRTRNAARTLGLPGSRAQQRPPNA